MHLLVKPALSRDEEMLVATCEPIDDFVQIISGFGLFAFTRRLSETS